MPQTIVADNKLHNIQEADAVMTVPRDAKLLIFRVPSGTSGTVARQSLEAVKDFLDTHDLSIPVMAIMGDVSVEALNENQMRDAGWVRAPADSGKDSDSNAIPK